MTVSRVDLGIGQTIKIGCWTPIAVHIEGQLPEDARCQVIAPDPDGNPTIAPLAPIQSSPTGSLVKGLIRSGRLAAPVRVEVLAGDRVIARRLLTPQNESLKTVSQETQFWLQAGEQPAFAIAARLWNSARLNGVVLANLAEFPSGESALALDSVNAVILQADQPVSAELADQLRLWVNRGGRLVIVVGSQFEALRASPLAQWLPLLPAGVQDLRELGNLRDLVPGSSSLRVLASVPAAQFEITPSSGRVAASTLNGPLVIHSGYGAGIVTMVAVDLSRRPLSNWDESSQAELATRILEIEPAWKIANENRSQTYASGAELNPTGVSDLQTQLLNSLDYFENVPRPQLWSVLGWVFGLVIVLGPLDYLIVHRFLKRPHWSWFTLPLWAGLIAFASTQLGTTINGFPLTSRQMDLVDFDLQTGTLRSRSWISFYSPATQRYQIGFDAAADLTSGAVLSESKLSWVERPEASFRGMYRSGGTDLGKPSYSLNSSQSEIANLPVRLWSTGSVEAFWETTLDADKKLLQANLSDDGSRRLGGQFVHNLPGELEDWIICYENFAYYRSRSQDQRAVGGGLAAGEMVHLAQCRSGLVRNMLVGLTSSLIPGKARDKNILTSERTIHDPLLRDPSRIAELVTFHDVSGGRSYTGLTNEPLAGAELSRQLTVSRAVLLGKLKQPATRFTIDAVSPPVEQQDAFVRIIIPVQRSERATDAPPPSDLLRKRG